MEPLALTVIGIVISGGIEVALRYIEIYVWFDMSVDKASGLLLLGKAIWEGVKIMEKLRKWIERNCHFYKVTLSLRIEKKDDDNKK
jgi:hypothetical protein